MDRRRYLALLTAGVAPAGCTNDRGPDVESDTNDTEIRREALRDALVSEDIEVHELRVDGGRVALVYSPPVPEGTDESTYEEHIEDTVETTAFAFYRRVRGGWDVEGVDASVLVDDSAVATWRMESEWVAQYRSGEIAREELTGKIEATVERHDEES
jgi:hypothetical protein